eukprot:c10304_g2_i1 orf=1-642(-)
MGLIALHIPALDAPFNSAFSMAARLIPHNRLQITAFYESNAPHGCVGNQSKFMASSVLDPPTNKSTHICSRQSNGHEVWKSTPRKCEESHSLLKGPLLQPHRATMEQVPAPIVPSSAHTTALATEATQACALQQVLIPMRHTNTHATVSATATTHGACLLNTVPSSLATTFAAKHSVNCSPLNTFWIESTLTITFFNFLHTQLLNPLQASATTL